MILMLFVSPLLLACSGTNWRTVRAYFGRQQVDIATCSSQQVERCQKIKRQLESGETVMTVDPEYVRELAMARENSAINESTPPLVNTIYPTNEGNQWIAEVGIWENGRVHPFEYLFTQMTPDLSSNIIIYSIYFHAMSEGGKYDPWEYDEDEDYINAMLDIHSQRIIRYTGPLTIGIGNTGTRSCSFPVNPFLERQRLKLFSPQ